MKNHLSLAWASVLLLATMPALAGTSEPLPQAQPEAGTSQPSPPNTAPLEANALDVAVTAADKDDAILVCKREKTTGSHMTSRICRTKAQIRYENEEARAALAKGINTGKALAGDQ